ncbi:MAG: aldo/keto reductase [Acidobacteriota bacterium]|nr:aldo/keto reductase [Acidobacteriota bacterium]
MYGAWRALEEAYTEGKIRAIGVSNFDSKQLMDLCAFAGIKPMLNQVETHVFWQERPEHEVMVRLGVQHMAWGPFAEGANGFFTNPLLSAIGAKYDKSVGQIALRFLMDEGVIVIPKSSKPARMAENIDVFDFELTESDREQIRTLDTGTSLILDHHNLATVQFLLDRIKGQIDAGR